MNRNLNGFFYQQKAHCKLISFLNFLHIKQPQLINYFTDDMYNQMVAISNGVFGSCTNIEIIYSLYEYKQEELKVDRQTLRQILNDPTNLPLIVEYVDPIHYSHSALITNFENNKITMVNSGYENDTTTIDQLYMNMFDDQQYKYIIILKMLKYRNEEYNV